MNDRLGVGPGEEEGGVAAVGVISPGELGEGVSIGGGVGVVVVGLGEEEGVVGEGGGGDAEVVARTIVGE